MFAATRGDVSANAEAQQRLVTVQRRLRSRTMPPDDEAQPGAAEYAELIAAFGALHTADPDAQITTIRRLSRRQYENTLADLTGIAWSGENVLPDDARTYGFDNLGGAASITPLLFEKYLSAATAIAEAMLDDAVARTRPFPRRRAAADDPARIPRARVPPPGHWGAAPLLYTPTRPGKNPQIFALQLPSNTNPRHPDGHPLATHEHTWRACSSYPASPHSASRAVRSRCVRATSRSSTRPRAAPQA
jgi:hypothetical protein